MITERPFVFGRKRTADGKDLFGCCLMLLLILFATVATTAQDSTLVPFQLKDQFDIEHTDDQYHGNIAIMIGADRGGSAYNDDWGIAIFDALEGESGYDLLKSLPVADMRGVPFFMKGFVKGKFPKEPEKWVLLDWKGHLAKAYEFEKDMSNIVIFDPEGSMILKASVQAMDEVKLRRMLRELRVLMQINAN